VTGRLLGVDFGVKRVGLAVSDPDRIIASPLVTYERIEIGVDATYFRNLVADERIAEIVVGLPVHSDGREGVKANEARAYGTWLAQTTGLPVQFWDERFSTAQAETALWNAGLTHQKRKDRRDRVAAQMILQAYIEAGCPNDEGAGPMISDPS
jgi:putative holliday junction resolvase